MQRLVFVAFLLVVGTVSGQQPIQQQPLQTPPKWMTQNGVLVPLNAQPENRPLPPGHGSPHLIGQQGVVPQPQRPSQPVVGQPMYVAQANPAVASAASPPAVGVDGQQYRHIGRSESEFRVVPFVLTPAEQKELDEFLVRWEKFSANIKRFDVDFTLYQYDPTIEQTNKPAFSTYGYFKYIAPNRFAYHVVGQWINGEQVKGKKEEKTIIDGTSIFLYDFNAETVRQFEVPKELLERGFAESPLPLIFGAKADEMKRRYSMQIVTGEEYKDTQIWLQARPLLLADQQEFRCLEIRIDKKTLRATALKKDDINGKAYTVYVLSEAKIYGPGHPFNLGLTIREFFTPTVPRDWKHVVVDDALLQSEQPRTAGPPQNPPPNLGNEIKLY